MAAPAVLSPNTQLGTTVADLQRRMGLHETVGVRIVAWNARLVSVTRSTTNPASFEIAFDREFLEQLSSEERIAAVAHELGHVWLFTHPPYNQSEGLANERALQMVSLESLNSVYEKVWEFEGKRGTFKNFLAQVEFVATGSH